ncbi:MAG: hypothetical protein LC749_11430, partial [Actinobacteria bacterium]|nr:hypothetical protein [Actinomycetota bacterium]
VRVRTGPETADNLTHARRALTEVHQRRAAEQRFAAGLAHSHQLARWHDDDHTATHHAPELTLDGTQ